MTPPTRAAAAALAAATLATAALAVLAPAPGCAAPPAIRPHPHRRPWPVTITVRTVPALPGVRLTLDGRPLVTDANGAASYTAEHNVARHTLVLLDSVVNQPTRRYRFKRWAGQRDPNQAFRTTVTGLPMRADYTITAAYTVQYPVVAHLVDQHGAPLDLARVSSISVRSDTGRVLELPKTGTVWLAGAVPEYRGSTLVESTVYYSVQALTMGGTNIVDAGRQRFTPARGPDVTVTGQLHDLTVTGRDALFGSPRGSRVVVTGPDATVHRVGFDASHSATLHNLPRGSYRVTVEGAGGLVLDEQIRLSRDKQLRIAVVSRGDLATIGGTLVLFAVVLLVAGRFGVRRLVSRGVGGVARRLRPAAALPGGSTR